MVLGEAGVGKSRLVYQLHEHLAAVPHTWLECRASPYTAGTPFHPIIALVAQGLAFTPEDTAAEKLGKLEVGLRTLASELANTPGDRSDTDGLGGRSQRPTGADPPNRRGAQPERVALLADFLGLPPPTRLQLSPELQRRKTIELLAQWTLAMSEVQPLVLFVEDLHWCDASTLELLGQVIAQSPTARVLLLATARPDCPPPWPARSNLTTVQLARLTKRQARELATALGGAALPAATLEALVARADGVPLYVEELSKAVAESGAGHGVEAIPATLADSLMARLDRLSAAKEVAQRAAVLGREFGYPLLAATAGLDEAALRQGLGRLVEAEIVFARGEPPAATYTFKHALIQETAYQSLLKRTRQQLHARVAQVLEERFPERAAAEPEVVARHYDQAGLVAAAITHYQRAGERATRRSANEEAIGHLRRALDLVGTLPETRERQQIELGVQMAIGAPLMAARGWSHPEFEQTSARARALASQIGESPALPRVLVGVAAAYFVKGDLATALEVAQEALAAAERTGEPFDLLSAHLLVGQSLLYQGHFSRALQHLEQGVEFYNPSAHASLAYAVGIDRGVTAHSYAAYCQICRGDADRALALSEAGVALAQRVEHPFSLAFALLMAALVHVERGELDRVRERAEELVGLCERLGFPFWLGMGKASRGFTRVESGEGEAGLAEMQQALGELAAIGSGIGAPQFLCFLAMGLRKVGRHNEALGALGLGVARADAQGQHYYDAELHRLRGEILIAECGIRNADSSSPNPQSEFRIPQSEIPDPQAEAEACVQLALEIARRQEAKTFELRAATSLARLWQRQGRRDAARDLLGPVYEWFTEGFDTRDLRDAKAVLDEL